jgi:macrolide transport system ATP-binding/permease protein
MRWYYKLPLRLGSLFQNREAERNLNDEIQSHLQYQTEEYVRQGMDPEEARYAALRSLGGMEQVKEECREMRSVSIIEHFFQDLRIGFRMLWRTPGFSVLAILCLTLGIGANAAVFSWIEGLLLRPFPAVAQQDRLVVLVGTKRGAGDKGETASTFDDVSWPDFVDLRGECTLIDAFIADKIMGTTLSIGDRAEHATGSTVSANYFDALGVHPMLGRGFEPSEESGRNAHPVTVISYWMWKERFHSDPAIVGKTQMLNGVQHTIIGVAPEGFYGTFVGWPIQFWVPVSMQEVFEPGGYKLEDRGATWIEGFARLKPGVTLEQAQQEISAVAQRLENDHLATNRGRGIRLLPLWKAPFNQASALLPMLEIALGVVFVVLLIACANVSSLLLVRSFARRKEITVRMAIGARRGRLFRQLLTEGLILSTLATAGGLLVAYLCRNLLVLFFPSSSGMAANLHGEIDWRVLAFSAGICLASTLFFGLFPAFQASQLDLATALKSESGSVFGSQGRSRFRSALVLVQLSLCFVLLVGGVLLIQSLRQVRSASPGFSTENVLTTGVDLIATGYDAQRAKTFQDQLLDRVQALPGVESASWARVQPFSYIPFFSAPITVQGYLPAPDEQPTAEYNQVGPGFFATMGIPILSGREFDRADNETAPLVAVVNEKMVQQYWHGEDPVGRGLQVKDQWLRVVGVAKQAKYSTFAEAPKAFFYVPMRQKFSIRASLNIRTAVDPATMATALAREMHALDANVAPLQVMTMRKYINFTALTSQQIVVALLGIFGGLALLLAAIGLYGVMSYAVSQSTRELALRMALGAAPSDLLWLVLSHGFALTAGGVLLGTGAALALTRLVGSLLYEVSPRDPLAFVVAFAAMAITSWAACFLPAWRATRIDPVRALRE